MKKLTLFLLPLFFAQISFAGLNIEPMRVEMTMQPNTQFKGSYEVLNTYENDVEVNVEVSARTNSSYKANADIPVDSWLQVMPLQFTVKKGEKRLVLYSILTNESMQGSIVGQVSFIVKPYGNSGVNVKTSLPVYITIQGTEKINFSVDSLSIDSVSSKLYIDIKNDSNINIKPIGVIDIYKDKTKINSIQLLESSTAFIDTITKGFNVVLPKGLDADTTYRAEVTIDILGYLRRVKSAVKSIEFRVNKDGSYEALK